ncbi:glycerol-3-phosphate 1-O-acyltransferase PlsY [Falsirhodobacter sp. 20TX0035]|uniref:glycerol-3-phosphate 1-O-acyltransferase PlsY n=1 Tax=Falsirhodobacter sp. 20TX0035 TaxID=3022019 RepID=UPI00232E87B7|nr:glycerol-3-phosphate 1-O-acyltransferase PlsY [Falsirhodobacter sp. 20TX0035]MDB6452232.1 glycerol-3-phosphate 1-O-acyltransferase PlsY [Falsirhodobacter sp. 20TX0035]
MPVFETALPLLLLTGVLAYLLGSVPFGIVITRAMGLGDLRKIGSGNIGATNVLRTGNKPAALATLILDAGKGGMAVLIARALVGPDAALVAGVMAFFGHLFPVWLGFKGGKGVATFLGTLLALAWPVGLLACATWAVVAAIFRFSSLAGILAAVSAPVWAVVTGHGAVALAAALMALMVLIRHDANIRRLIAGTEPKIGKKT